MILDKLQSYVLCSLMQSSFWFWNARRFLTWVVGFQFNGLLVIAHHGYIVSFRWTVRAGTNATRAGGCRVARDSAAGFKQNLEGWNISSLPQVCARLQDIRACPRLTQDRSDWSFVQLCRRNLAGEKVVSSWKFLQQSEVRLLPL